MPVVLQSLSPLSSGDIESVRSLFGSATYEMRAPNVAAIEWVHELPSELRVQLDAICANLKLDYAWIPDEWTFGDFRVLAMDMDSTLITIECIDEIADFCGLKPQVAAITEASMRGEIKDFNESLTRRVELLKGLDASVMERVYAERLQLSPGAERMLKAVQAMGIRTLLVSGGFEFFTSRLQERLGLDRTRANTLEIVDGKLTGRVLGEIVNADVKAQMLKTFCKDLGVTPQEAIAMGDGSNDLKMMSVAGLSVAFRAKPIVQAQADVAFNVVGLDGLLNLFPQP
ncbi:phosphoserine phosphatase SerB [Ralstonia syzygii subsp. celebesensis]|uniref:Phosphoserine phosphatase n=3 Tax=Ralstonia syzygii TaxID=28097 RepID=A0A1U9VFU4_9RALS|nr:MULTISPECIES: phosphoserine phosphatase SerB [Ralstonia solanacearum species complex]CCA79962.1 phosphoserine phosphatase [blood disease bacterium R229]AQW29574.1 phosphoserine phosphatase SerB [blood disease bacterium A2-HR MARDI]AXW52602.1 phosphoserine phosphatase SerB [Ralstonia solanacearum]QQV56556.1 phosphoserine phosphatase SerB [Ralstonia syzygii subsp. celebesensis]QUP53729.1 phosphoserine phosphatase SerB [Ralstonia syzygii]